MRDIELNSGSSEVSLDSTVLLFTLAVSVGAGLLFGIFPLLRAGRGQLAASLKEGGRGGMRDRKSHRVQNILAVSQMALALLIVSGLVLRTFQYLGNSNPGFGSPDEVLSLRVNIPPQEVPRSEDVASSFEAMARRLAEVPGVESVGLATGIPMDGWGNVNPFYVQGQDLDPDWPLVTLGFWEVNAADQVQVGRGAGFATRSSRVGTSDFIDEVRPAIWEVNSNLPVDQILPLTVHMATSMAAVSFTMVLLGIAGAVALILGLVGVYGVISYAVSQRSRELATRMALGAQPGQVKGMILRQGLVLAGLGVVTGLILAGCLTRLMAALLVGVSPVDPLTYSLVTVGLLAVALTASYLPARRATIP